MKRNKGQRYTWYEGATAFYVVDTETGTKRCMGDGVGMFSTVSGRSLNVATKPFYAALNRMFRDEQATIGEAYFG
jgi:hypothetical protein